ncbi:methyltransferase domain-containing protein [Algisphaera agarilytica]|uniref:SAM-dependent methyltransferase n=1 Tax=Algisphaera agarilytica TaxID=1385975 RepID=A0A7X0H3I0_9BACT|nr:methyltransferase domain-containing protein [Algisphaera agarilytica]MBB6428555.1 SAM-dependent methyltransferase [Algisphaera agarilytica]
MIYFSFFVLFLVVLLIVLHEISYKLVKTRILRMRKWDLNICCGHSDGGGLNVDIFQHDPGPGNFQKIDDIYSLPFDDKQFEHTLCSHTIEHVDDPEAFFAELRRVSKNVTIVVPPLWDPAAVFNVFEHRHIFLNVRKMFVNELPPYVKLPMAETIQERLGQKIRG